MNLGNACEMQEMQLVEIQAMHQKELYESGVASRALHNVSQKEQKAITDATSSGVPVRVVVYSRNIVYSDGRPTTHEYGVCFVVPNTNVNNLFKRPETPIPAPVATLKNDEPVPYNENQTPEATRDARIVYSMAHQLFTARHNGRLPDLSADLMTILDTTKPYTPSPIINR